MAWVQVNTRSSKFEKSRAAGEPPGAGVGIADKSDVPCVPTYCQRRKVVDHCNPKAGFDIRRWSPCGRRQGCSLPD